MMIGIPLLLTWMAALALSHAWTWAFHGRTALRGDLS